MKTPRRIVAVLLLLLGGAGLLLCLAALVGIWPGRTALRTRLDTLFGRVEAVITRASNDLILVQSAIQKSRESLAAFKKAPAPMGEEPKRSFLFQTLSRTVGRELAPQAGDLRATMTRVAEGSVVLKAIIDDIGGLPFSPVKGDESDKLDDVNELLGRVTKTAQELSVLFPETPGTQDSDRPEVRIPDAEQALDRIDGLIQECSARLENFTSREATLRSTVNTWMTQGPIVATVLLIWMALGQVSLFLLGRRLFRSS